MRLNTRSERADAHVPPWTRLEHQARYRFAASLIRGGSVLDCACGDGSGAVHFVGAGAQTLTGYDHDPAAVEAARRAAGGAAARFEVADAGALPQPTGSVDLYISLETIEHVPDAHALLSEAVRVLRPTGRFVCSTPNRAVQNPGAALTDPPLCAFHLREYTPRELLDLLSQYFGRVEFHGQNEVGALRRCWLRAVGRLPSHRLAARLGQVAKLTRVLADTPERHTVVPVRAGHVYDLTVAVCSEPL